MSTNNYTKFNLIVTIDFILYEDIF